MLKRKTTNSISTIVFDYSSFRYLRTGTRRVQKRKTATVKMNYNPEYHAKLKYNACNVMGTLVFCVSHFLFDCFMFRSPFASHCLATRS